MKNLTREDILGIADLKIEPVEVWGGVVYVRGMTGAERDSFEASLLARNKKDVDLSNVRARLCALTICDEQGNRLFTEADVKALGAKAAGELQKVFTVAQRLSGLTEEDAEELGLQENPFGGSASG